MTDTKPEWKAFRNALAKHDFALAEQLFSKNTDLIRLTNALGETALHWLAVEDDTEAVHWLLQHGADANTRNTFGIPMLFEVALLEYKELLRWLLANGADADLKDMEGLSLSEFLEENTKPHMERLVEELRAGQHGPDLEK
jgi:ankyrin repeat protein